MVFLASYCKLSQTLKFSNEFSPNGFLNCKFTISFQPAVPTELMTAVCKAGWVHRTALACQPKALAHPHRSHPHSRSLVTTNSGPRPARPNHSCPGSFLGSYNHSRRLTFHNFILSYRLVFQRTMKKSTLLKKKKEHILSCNYSMVHKTLLCVYDTGWTWAVLFSLYCDTISSS